MGHSDWQTVREKFQQIWGYHEFRPPQGEIVQSLLAGQDALIVLPTGGGKSICFQLPALLQAGLTVVVSPLVALMENQVQELRDRNLPAASLHSELPRRSKQYTLRNLKRLRLLYLSPETLLNPQVWEVLAMPDLPINGLILDEAHCLVQWGETFRPAYRRLGTVRPALQARKPDSRMAIAAFTATADSTAQQILSQVLQLQNPQHYCYSPYRPNLHLAVKRVWTPKGRRQQTLNFIRQQGRNAGLVYVRSRSEGEALAKWLQGKGYATAAYHAGLSPDQRRSLEHQWLKGQLQFVVCTSAFGMGINKPNVRWVVHFQPPVLLSEYVQEIGRGGRDGKPAFALTLVGERTGFFNPEDKNRDRFFLQKQEQQYQKAAQLMPQLPQQGNIAQLLKQIPKSSVALSLLHSAGLLEYPDPFHYQQKAGNPSQSLRRLMRQQQKTYQKMQQFLATKDCRWQFLLQAFGFQEEANGFRCGHCDRCSSRNHMTSG
ncbi:MAG: ATP-dependent DNA helicase RecQ [Kamptonema sp. SIO4C4]|nr:ATP-dependent DNA helicase RecQ [Kamptonema sp. SIO4C4]